MEVKLELQAPEMVFNPSLDQESPEGFYMLMEGLVDDMFKVATLVPRVAKHSGQEDYGVSAFVYITVMVYCVGHVRICGTVCIPECLYTRVCVYQSVCIPVCIYQSVCVCYTTLYCMYTSVQVCICGTVPYTGVCMLYILMSFYRWMWKRLPNCLTCEMS